MSKIFALLFFAIAAEASFPCADDKTPTTRYTSYLYPNMITEAYAHISLYVDRDANTFTFGLAGVPPMSIVAGGVWFGSNLDAQPRKTNGDVDKNLLVHTIDGETNYTLNTTDFSFDCPANVTEILVAAWADVVDTSVADGTNITIWTKLYNTSLSVRAGRPDEPGSQGAGKKPDTVGKPPNVGGDIVVFYSSCECSTCTDAVLNGDEDDVDCGGSCLFCCGNGLKDNGEDDVDCGGFCLSCCDNDVKDNGEDDVDCGGSCLPCLDIECDFSECGATPFPWTLPKNTVYCPYGSTCAWSGDPGCGGVTGCYVPSGVEPKCQDGTILDSIPAYDINWLGGNYVFCDGSSYSSDGTCDDGYLNNGEDDVDCGGFCEPCCGNGVKDNGEDDVDCGGFCEPCCGNGVKDNGEDDVDCGGSCLSCCNNSVKDNGEDDVDCGGSCDACITCYDGMKNQDEEGIDCGGTCNPCEPCPSRTTSRCGLDGVQCLENITQCITYGLHISYDGGAYWDGSYKYCTFSQFKNIVCHGGSFLGVVVTHPITGSLAPSCWKLPSASSLGIIGTVLPLTGAAHPGYPIPDGWVETPASTLEEIGIYTGDYNYAFSVCTTCSDGILNGNEEGVDCGGSCLSCCNNGVKDNGEDDVDCGGSCLSCCNNGVKDNGEDDVDCGGSCLSCCNNSVKDNGEDDVDCGGSCLSCCNNNLKDNGEDDVDCGGSCEPCNPCLQTPNCTGQITPYEYETVDGVTLYECRLTTQGPLYVFESFEADNQVGPYIASCMGLAEYENYYRNCRSYSNIECPDYVHETVMVNGYYMGATPCNVESILCPNPISVQLVVNEGRSQDLENAVKDSSSSEVESNSSLAPLSAAIGSIVVVLSVIATVLFNKRKAQMTSPDVEMTEVKQ